MDTATTTKRINDDRISQLPEFISHHILSSLVEYPEELVRMSVLSNHWFALTASFPILDFDITRFMNAGDDVFSKYVDYTLSRFFQQKNVNMYAFKLVSDQRVTELDIVDRWLELVLKKGSMQELALLIYPKHMPMCRLPNILLSVSSLTSLTISYCELPSSLMTDDVNFKSLKWLDLRKFCIDDKVITRLTTSCPLLEKFIFRNCYGFSRFCIHGHQNLHRLEMKYFNEVERIHIEAPNLHHLYLASSGKRDAPCINLASCKNLLSMCYIGNTFLNSKGFTDLSNFPLIEDLCVSISSQRYNMKLSSRSLRRLVLCSSYDFELIELNTPSLHLLHYSNDLHMCFSRGRDSKAQMVCYLKDGLDTLWFQKVRQFVDKKNGFKPLKLYIHASTQSFINIDKLKAIQMLPFELEHVELELDFSQESPMLVAFVDVVLWCCCPRFLTLRTQCVGFKQSRDVVKFTYEKLLQQQDPGQTYIQIELSSSSKDKKHFFDLNYLLTTLPDDQAGKTLTFMKGEVVQEAG